MRGLEVIPAPRMPLRRRWLLHAVNAALLLGGLAGSAALYRHSLRSGQTVPGIVLGTSRLGALEATEIDRAIEIEAQRFGAASFALELDGRTVMARRRELGATIDIAATRQRLLSVGRSGRLLRDLADRVQARRGRLLVPLVIELERETALELFMRLKELNDRPAIAARLDLDGGRVVPGMAGQELRVYDCMAAAELALRRGESRARLAVVKREPAGLDPRHRELDISDVLATFATAYSLSDKDADRAHNLKVGAAKLDGKVLQPGETLSFNQEVGARTEAEGYRMAPVITEGELVDGMAGGACQLSSNLFSAAFFAGLDLLSSRPHTRPSSYVKMGLDAAVAYPSTDLVIRNPYPFPVAIHFTVNQGKVNVRILGKQRPWRKIVFEREVKEELPFREEQRPDPSIPKGQSVISQVGVPGFRLVRRRLFHGKGREPERTEERDLYYPPTMQYVKVGTGPADASWKPPPAPSSFGAVPPELRIEQ